jgi:hypothetical protein
VAIMRRRCFITAQEGLKELTGGDRVRARRRHVTSLDRRAMVRQLRSQLSAFWAHRHAHALWPAPTSARPETQ